MDKCQLKNPPFYQCCCQCKNRKKYFDNEGSIYRLTGYVCVLLQEEPDDMVTECPEHSCGCECFDDRRLE
jgi:hypothetical protein